MWTKLVVPSIGSTMNVGAEVSLEVEVEDSSPRKLNPSTVNLYHRIGACEGRKFRTSSRGRQI